MMLAVPGTEILVYFIYSAYKINPMLTEKVPPPTDGEFFYTVMRSGGADVALDIHGSHRVDTLVSDGNQKLALGINTEEPYFTVYSKDCP